MCIVFIIAINENAILYKKKKAKEEAHKIKKSVVVFKRKILIVDYARLNKIEKHSKNTKIVLLFFFFLYLLVYMHFS